MFTKLFVKISWVVFAAFFGVAALGQTITGVISLPAGKTASTNISPSVSVCSSSIDGSFFDCEAEVFTIAEGESSVNYFLEYTLAGNEGMYSVFLDCFGCDAPYLKRGQYLQADGSIDQSFTYIGESLLANPINFELLEGQVLNGTITLPSGEAAIEDLSVIVEVCSSDSSGGLLGCDSVAATILAGSNSGEYSLAYVPAGVDGTYNVSLGCFNCSPYLNQRQYLQTDGSAGLEFSSVDEALLLEPVNFELIEGERLAGVIRLPSGQVSERDLLIGIDLCIYSALSDLLGCESRVVTMPIGVDSLEYFITYLPFSNGSLYELSVECGSCAPYLPQTKYILEDGSEGVGVAPLQASQLTASIDFELVEGLAITGSVGLPMGQVADADISPSITICSTSASGSFLGCNSRSFVIGAGSNSSSYGLFYIPAGVGGRYDVSVGCIECDPYFSGLQYFQSDGSMSLNFAQVNESALSGSIDLVLSVDTDSDGVINRIDNCDAIPNFDQSDIDDDGDGDVCDSDADGDNVLSTDDSDDLNPQVCRDADQDLCDDCSSGIDNVANDGQDLDNDGICSLSDLDDSESLCIPIKAVNGSIALICL